MEKYDPYAWCFACGQKNPIGLHLTFKEEDGCYISEFTANENHQGYPGIMHGGLVSTLLDEIMARYIYAKGWFAVTAKLDVRYNKPTPIGQPLVICSRIIKEKGNLIELSAEISLYDGTVTAEGKSKVMIVKKLEDEFIELR